MDGHRFDAVLTHVTIARRSLIAGLLAGALGWDAYDVSAGKRGKKKGKGKGKKKDKSPSPPPDFIPCSEPETPLDCPIDFVCYNGRCTEGCRENGDCRSLYSCLRDEGEDLGRCIPGCVDHAYCEQQMGTRLSRCNFTTFQCERIECIFDTDCTPPKTCRDNFTCTCPSC